MRFGLVERYTLLRAAFRRLLAEFDGDITFVEAASVNEFIQMEAREKGVDLIVFHDLAPDPASLAQISALHSHFPDAPIVALTGSVDGAWARAAIDAGVRGFIPKSVSPRVLRSAIGLVLSGEVFIPSSLFAAEGVQVADDARQVRTRFAAGPLAGLSNRQIEVLSLLASGKSNSAIANALDIEETTVKNHVQAILRTLKVQNRTQAVLIAVRAGLAPQTFLTSGAA